MVPGGGKEGESGWISLALPAASHTRCSTNVHWINTWIRGRKRGLCTCLDFEGCIIPILGKLKFLQDNLLLITTNRNIFALLRLSIFYIFKLESYNSVLNTIYKEFMLQETWKTSASRGIIYNI